jgi:hypothetical protein
LRNIHTHEATLPKINLKAGGQFETPKNRLKRPQVVDRSLTNTNRVIGVLEMRDDHFASSYPETSEAIQFNRSFHHSTKPLGHK